ncbi:MAG: hypothetical protein RQ826_17515, partial [Xanthomonadales bacterium]|nr:hypothetical protein [Xanthomonadales bacterium]
DPRLRTPAMAPIADKDGVWATRREAFFPDPDAPARLSSGFDRKSSHRTTAKQSTTSRKMDVVFIIL